MRSVGLGITLLLLGAAQARAQDEAAPALEVPPGAEPAAPAEAPPAPAPAPVAPPVAAPPPPAAAPPPVYVVPPPSYPRPAPPPEYDAPRASPLYPGQSPQGYANPAYPPPAGYAQPSYAPPPTYAAPRAYEPPVYTLPPLPPGYTYVPVPTTGANTTGLSPGDLARRDQLYRELYQVETRLDHLQREQISTGGPITMMIIGYGGTLLATGIALSAYDAAEQIEQGWDGEWHDYELDADEDGDIDEHDENRFRKTARISAGVAAGTLTLGILATVRLVKRVAARRAQRLEVKELTQQRQNVRQQLDYGAAVAAGQTGFTIRGKF